VEPKERGSKSSNGKTPVISSAPLMKCRLGEQNIVHDVEESFTKLGSKFCTWGSLYLQYAQGPDLAGSEYVDPGQVS
jgi:hypothetical protein